MAIYNTDPGDEQTERFKNPFPPPAHHDDPPPRFRFDEASVRKPVPPQPPKDHSETAFLAIVIIIGLYILISSILP
jgi:hypothetical protein